MSLSRKLSGIVAGIYLLIGLAEEGGEGAAKVVIGLIMPLACIWFSEAMGGYTGFTASGGITEPTPGVIVWFMGWVLLLLPLLIGVIIWL
jgi:hypothetical protein